MGSMLRFDTERRELVRERRQARIERKRQRRDEREQKRAHVPATEFNERAPVEAIPELAGSGLVAVGEMASNRVDRLPGNALAANSGAAGRLAAVGSRARVSGEHPETARPDRASRRERDIAEFRERRREATRVARREARARIARTGELAAVADALAALRDPSAGAWCREREQLEHALDAGRVAEVGAMARSALWAIARDAARTSHRARRDPDLALAACVACAVLAQLPRTALRITERARPTVRVRFTPHRAFWR
jgi:hypothetical protein